MYYKSTRGNEQRVSSSEAVLYGMANDGGLYMPEYIPYIEDISYMKKMSYQEIAYEILKLYFTDYTEIELKECIEGAYSKENFNSDNIVELNNKDGYYFLELYHGKTIAFKDMALSILPRLLSVAVKKNNINKKVLILTATSGDTGKAALEGFKDIDGIDIAVFYPKGGVSRIQELQMLTQEGNNTHVIAVEGNFDDAQNGVKEIFNDREFNEKLLAENIILSSANSINIGRLVPQIIYYFYTYLNLADKGKIKFGDTLNVCVPTGNFGNIFAAYLAKKMGLPINKLICASNENKVLYDFINTGIYDKNRPFILTKSPSMDILISSNLERLLYILSGCDCKYIKGIYEEFRQSGKFVIRDDIKDALNKEFISGYMDDERTLYYIKYIFDKEKYLIDTHTAVSYGVCKEMRETSDDIVIASTASPYKFVYDVLKALKNEEHLDDFIKACEELSKISEVDIPEAVNSLRYKDIKHNIICKKDSMANSITDLLNL